MYFFLLLHNQSTLHENLFFNDMLTHKVNLFTGLGHQDNCLLENRLSMVIIWLEKVCPCLQSIMYCKDLEIHLAQKRSDGSLCVAGIY